MEKQKHLVVVLSEPSEGQDEAYHDYYENTHLDEVLATTGWKRAQRYALVDQKGAPCELPYLAMYEAYAEDSTEIIKTMDDTRSQRQQSKSLNKKTAAVWVFRELGDEHETQS